MGVDLGDYVHICRHTSLCIHGYQALELLLLHLLGRSKSLKPYCNPATPAFSEFPRQENHYFSWRFWMGNTLTCDWFPLDVHSIHGKLQNFA